MIATATRRAWIARDSATLVPDGHEAASILMARAGQRMPESQLARFANAHEFFDGIPKPAEDAEQADEADEAEKAAGGAPRRGRPPKPREEGA